MLLIYDDFSYLNLTKIRGLLPEEEANYTTGRLNFHINVGILIGNLNFLCRGPWM